MDHDYDLITIGAGSGGVRASRVAASHGARVAVAEEHRVGGTCVIRGCVPKKLLVYGAHFAEDLADARRFGWDVPACRFSWPTLRDNVLAEVDRLHGLYCQTLGNAGVDILEERAVVVGPNTVRLAGGRKMTARHILIATGARPVLPDCAGCELGITSNEVFHLPELPRRIVIAGGGYIANEFAGIFNELGVDVTILNRSDVILRGYEREVVERLRAISTAKGIRFHLNAVFDRIERRDDGTLVSHLSDGATLESDAILYAIGRVPHTAGLGLEAAGVRLKPNGAVAVDDASATAVPSIHAVGDVTDRIQLTPIAIREGQAFADTVFGGLDHAVDWDCVPAAVFSHPPMAGVGVTEERARRDGRDIAVYRSDFRAMKNVLAGRDERGLYKMICDAGTGRVIGLHMIGPDAPEILQAAAIAVKAGLTKADFDATVALHPSMAEELVLMR